MQFGLMGVLSQFWLPSVGGSVLGALVGSKVASSRIFILGSSYGVCFSSINLAPSFAARLCYNWHHGALPVISLNLCLQRCISKQFLMLL
jgi:hypothetical protein